MLMQVIHTNFRCEDCGNTNFTVKDNFDMDVGEITLNCSNTKCKASYTFRPAMKFSSSWHPPKMCSCKRNELSSIDIYCRICGKKNPNLKKGSQKSNGGSS